ncbi:MAG TPA: Tex-like N-terminal domain-containing protein, partial [Syntrophorhabdaceae bacterium]
MKTSPIKKISLELRLAYGQVQAAARLLAEGATIPFIARYRKEATGSLDEVALGAIRDRLEELDQLDDRRAAVLRSLQERDLLSEELRDSIDRAETMAALEDLYLPYRPKRRTRASIARERGLEPLAQRLFSQDASDPVTRDPLREAEQFINPEQEIHAAEEALAGARDIIAEWINEDAGARAAMRSLFLQKARFKSQVVAGRESEGVKYMDYYDWEEPVLTTPSHRVLAVRRGEKEGVLALHVVVPERDAIHLLVPLFVKGTTPASLQVKQATEDSYRRLLFPSMETEIRMVAKARADEEAIAVFADNLRQLLLVPPLGQKAVLAIDPGFRTGCKVVCLDRQGTLLRGATIYPHRSRGEAIQAADTLVALCHDCNIEAIAVGNGTGGRETEAFLDGIDQLKHITVMSVNESGASVYSASEIAREEFPDQDITVRGAISIGRRLMDPLAELVKVDPKAIGVGQYQHDVDQSALKKSL